MIILQEGIIACIVFDFSDKLKHNSMRRRKVMELADALGYDIVWQKRTQNVQLDYLQSDQYKISESKVIFRYTRQGG